MTTKKVISVGQKKKRTSKGTMEFMQEVVYKTKLPNGKFSSKTKHEIVNKSI